MSASRTTPRLRPRTTLAALAACAAAVTVLTIGGPAAAAGSSHPGVQLGAIQPGGTPAIHVRTPVNVVFIGYQPKQVDTRRILSKLPAQGDPIVRTGPGTSSGPDVGLRYDYSYNLRFAGKSFDDAFFSYLTSIGLTGSIEPFQAFYNEEVHRTLDVGPTSLYIDATATESWLEQQARTRLGIDAAQDTVFLIDWYGRSDFQFHEFYHHGVDPDTGIDAAFRVGALTRGWGGQSGPTWFYDLLAGPNGRDESWDVDDADYDGDGAPDYRMPPVWEYGNTSGYRPFTDLSGDLAKLIRYVAIDLLFTPSPIYDPAATVPGVGGSKRIELDVLEGDPNVSGISDVTPGYITDQHEALEPYYPFSIDVTDQPMSAGAREAYHTAAGISGEQPCMPEVGDPDTAFYCYFRDHRAEYFSAHGQDAIIPAVGYTVPQNIVNFTGYALPDWTTSKPSYALAVDSPSLHQYFLQAYSHTLAHEVGHYVGLSHPHDGYDSTSGTDMNASDEFAFIWGGDASATAMSYVFAENTFSVFDKDNLARWELARLLGLADTDAQALLAAPRSAQTLLLLAKADVEFTVGVAKLRTGDWIGAATTAVAAYGDVQRADAAAGVTPASTTASSFAAAARAKTAASIDVGGAIDGDLPPSSPLPGSKTILTESIKLG